MNKNNLMGYQVYKVSSTNHRGVEKAQTHQVYMSIPT